jgi:hypothetical protein
VANNSQPISYSSVTQYGPWIVIAIVLSGAAQFDTTAKLASAFAYLVLVATILYYGQEAAINLDKIINPKLPGGK